MARAGIPQPVLSLPALETTLLEQRGVLDNGDSFFKPLYERDIHDPFLMSDMQLAVERVYQAVKNQERIVVYGDYDVDGLTSTALLISVLRQVGAAVVPFIPHRLDDGYGLNLAVAQRLAADFDVFITVDCGISNHSEIAWLKEAGRDVIIVDHHTIAEPAKLPSADAILHPRHPAQPYPSPWLSAAGVAWKLCQAVLRDRRCLFHQDASQEKWLLDLAMLGTVADMVPLIGENRAIASFGLQLMARSRRPGVQALLRKARLKVDELSSEVLSWRVIPQLNAAGKMDHAQPALDLLLAGSQDQAEVALAKLAQTNQQRQAATNHVLKEAEGSIIPDIPFIFLANPVWPAGVVGLVASRLSERFSRPAVVIGGNGRHAVGSARGPAAVNVLEFLRTGQEHFMKFGGHARAAGFSLAVEHINDLHQTLLAHGQQLLRPVEEKTEQADAVIAHSLISWDLAHCLERFSPYGEGNRPPRFIARAVPLRGSRPVGKTKEHAKVEFMVGDHPLEGIGFGLAASMPAAGDVVDILFGLSVSSFGGRRRLEVGLQAITPTGNIPIREYEERHPVH